MSVLLSPSEPLVVASVNGSDDLASALVAEPGADVLEWRLDGLQASTSAALYDSIMASVVPVMLTARREDEGGFAPWPNDEKRLEAMQNLASLARWIDIEARTLAESPVWREAAAGWRASGIGLVVSWHDFSGIPSPEDLHLAARVAEMAGAEVLKVAGTTSSLADVAALGLVFDLPGPSLRSVMGMGRFGKASRLLFADAGSVLNYGYLRAASVPGQWPAAELRQLLRDRRG